MRLTARDTASNRAVGRCALRVLSPSELRFSLVAPATFAAGKPFSVMVTVEEPFGALAPPYRAAVRLSCSDPGAVLPADYAFAASDASVHNLSGIVLRVPGSWTITATDPAGHAQSGTATVIVTK